MRWGAGNGVPGGEVRIAAAAVAHPPLRVAQAQAAQLLGELTGDPRRARALARGSGIDCRSVSAPLDCLTALRTIEERNTIYRRVAPAVASEAAARVLTREGTPGSLVTSSCTGYHLPGWGAGLVESLELGPDTWRLPITESGCAGGVVALTAAAQALAAGRGDTALAVAVELCSLSLHLDAEEGNLTSSLLFGDGGGAARLERGPGPGLRILGSSSTLIPGTQELLGFELRDSGLYPVLRRELVRTLPPSVEAAAGQLLTECAVPRDAVSAWLLHPGGAAILRGLESHLSLPEGSTRWSWQSMRENGNTSSAAIFDVLTRYLFDAPEPGSYAVIAAFGPGVSIEMLLVQAC